MHAVLQGSGQDSIPDPETSNYSRKTRPRLQGTFHLNAILGLMPSTQKLYFLTM
jgi:hypothetical protein